MVVGRQYRDRRPRPVELRPRARRHRGRRRGARLLGAQIHALRHASSPPSSSTARPRPPSASTSPLVYTVTFVIGAMLGALGGAVMAPKISVTLGIGVEVIVLAFAVVAIGGMGSIEGALVGALIVGLCRAAAVHLAAADRTVRHLRGDGAGPGVPALRPVRAGAAEEDLIWPARAHLVGALRVPASLAAAAPCAAAMAGLARHHRLRQCAGRARADRAVARRPRLVRPGALLLHRRLHGGADRALDRLHRRDRADRCSAASRPAWSPFAGRIPARALSRDFLRHAQPRAVDDPLRRAGEDGIARLDRRLPRRTPTFLGYAPHGDALGRALLLAGARLRRGRRLAGRRSISARVAGALATADPRQRDPRRIPRHVGHRHRSMSS